MFETIAAAFSMFTALPVPAPPYRERRYLLCAFPLTGLAAGAAWGFWIRVCQWLSIPAILRGAGLCLLPAAVTGGIHLDGYADTCDALASLGTPERRRAILRDPHCGAFAVIRLCMYFTGMFGLCTAMTPDNRAIRAMGGAFVLSRALSGAALVFLPIADGSAMAYRLAHPADRRVRGILAVESLFAAALVGLSGGWTGPVMLAAALAVLGCYIHTAKRAFGGTSGDLAGWFLQKAEFWMLAALVAAQYWEAL